MRVCVTSSRSSDSGQEEWQKQTELVAYTGVGGGWGAKASRNISRMRKAISVIPFYMMVQFVRISQNAALTN